MNPSTAQATVLVDELVRNGVTQIVLCPGSRSAALAMALWEADQVGRLRLHVRVDERSAAFLALGLSRLGRPAAVVCTSGTAVANLHPAVLEGFHAGVGMLVLTADRPQELHGTGANQTIDQRRMFGGSAGLVEFPVAERRGGQNPVWRALVCRAVAQAAHGRPVQLNLPFREPLVPTFEPRWPDALDGRPDGLPWTTAPAPVTLPGSRVDFPLPARTVMVVGSGRDDRAQAAAMVAASAGWPVIAEPTGQAAALAGGAKVLRCGALLLATGELPAAMRPAAVVVVGRPTLSRGVRGLLGAAPVCCVDDHPQWTDTQHLATHVRGWLDLDDMSHVDDVDPDWITAWQQADENVSVAVDKLVGEQDWPTGLRLAAELMAALPSNAVLFLGSSNPIRDVDLVAAPRADVEVYANRGVAGIDGSVSTALGLGLATGRQTYALLGDLTLLHDVNGLLLGPREPRPNLTVVVLNDDGGGIFSLLEQGSAEHKPSFERVFGTPHGVDLAALCAAYHVPHVVADTREALHHALRPAPGLRVVELRATRDPLRDLHARLRTTARESIARG